MKNSSNNNTTNKILFDGYQIFKKVIKYSCYLALIYFAYKGFMAWD